MIMELSVPHLSALPSHSFSFLSLALFPLPPLPSLLSFLPLPFLFWGLKQLKFIYSYVCQIIWCGSGQHWRWLMRFQKWVGSHKANFWDLGLLYKSDIRHTLLLCASSCDSYFFTVMPFTTLRCRRIFTRGQTDGVVQSPLCIKSLTSAVLLK